jgi:hypothetical protein
MAEPKSPYQRQSASAPKSPYQRNSAPAPKTAPTQRRATPNVFQTAGANIPFLGPMTTAAEIFGGATGNRKLWEAGRKQRDRNTAAAAGISNGFTAGLVDEALGFIPVVGPRLKRDYRQQEDRSKKGAPGVYMAGQLGGAIASPVNKIAIPARGSSLGGQMFAGAAGAGIQGGITGFGSATGNFEERLPETFQGAAIGATLGGLSVPAVNLIGRTGEAAGSVVNRLTNGGLTKTKQAFNLATGRQTPQAPISGLEEREIVRAIRGDKGQNVPLALSRMRTAQKEARRLGVTEPSIADLGGQNTRALARSAGMRQTPAREFMSKNAETVRSGLPDTVTGAGQRFISTDPRSVPVAEEALINLQRTNARQNYGSVRGDMVLMDPQTAAMLRSPDAKSAIKDAAGRASLRGEVEVAAELNRLADEVLDSPGQIELSVGALDRVKRVFDGRSGMAYRSGDNDAGGGYSGISNALRDGADPQSPGYAMAREIFSQDARRIGALDIGDNILNGSGNNAFLRETAGMTPQERALGALAARERLTGVANETENGPLNVISRMQAQNPQNRLAALVGPENSADYSRALAMEREAMRTANFMDTARGSQTAPLQQDQQALAGASEMFQAMRGSPIAMITVAAKGLGMRDAEAEAIAMALADRSRTDEVLAYLERMYGPQNGPTVFGQLMRAAQIGMGNQSGQAVN